MSKSISLFSGYAQKENRTTNYCLLILKMIYEENPKFLGEVLGALTTEEAGGAVGVQFRQQEKREHSVPDGLIVQPSFTVYIETKNFDWFYDDQLERHISALCQESVGQKILIALGNFEAKDINRFDRVRDLCTTKYHDQVSFAVVGFDDLIEVLQSLQLSKNLTDAVSDLASYFDEQNLLPDWETRLDVVNCATIDHEPLSGAYLCPAQNGAYWHKRSRFFGLYKWKTVSHVAEIQAVIDIDDEQEARVHWVNIDGKQKELIARARVAQEKWRAGRFPTRVFLLGDLFTTDFRKDSLHGMRTTKMYFRVEASSAGELAETLRGRTWSEWRQG